MLGVARSSFFLSPLKVYFKACLVLATGFPGVSPIHLQRVLRVCCSTGLYLVLLPYLGFLWCSQYPYWTRVKKCQDLLGGDNGGPPRLGPIDEGGLHAGVKQSDFGADVQVSGSYYIPELEKGYLTDPDSNVRFSSTLLVYDASKVGKVVR